MSQFDRWEQVVEIVDSWVSLHPREWNDFVAAMKERRASLKDKEFATTDSGEGLGRLLIGFPEPAKRKNRRGRWVWDDLQKMIEVVIPEFYHNDEAGRKAREHFAKEFHDFRFPEKV